MIANSLESQPKERDALELLQYRFARGLIILTIAASSIALLVQFVTLIRNKSDIALQQPMVALVLLAINIILWRYFNAETLKQTSVIIVLSYTILVALSNILLPEFVFVMLSAATLIAASILVNRWIFLLALAVVAVHEILEIIAIINSESGFTAEAAAEATLVIALIFISVVTRFLFNATRQTATTARHNAYILQMTAEIGQETNRLLSLEELLSNAVEQIRTRFGYNHVQIYLIDENSEQAVLAASTGKLGRELLERKHQIRVGSQGAVGQVTWHGEPILINAQQHFYNRPTTARGELLHEMRSRLVLPISDGTAIIGALDAQSIHANAFGESDMQALQVLSNMIGTSIRNSNLFEAQQRNLEENKRLFFEAQNRLQEIRRLNQQLTKSGWDEYLTTYDIVPGITLQEDTVVPETTWSETMTQAGRRRQPVNKTENGRHLIAVPILLRDQVIGAIEVEPAPGSSDTDTIEMMQAVASRLAVSLDNARLFEEAQQTTAQEQHISQIVEQYQSANSVDDLLRVTITELSELFGAERGAIRLVKDGIESSSQHHNGGMS